MKELRKTVWVPGEDIARYSALLSREPSCKEECLGEEHTITFTADFGGGMEMDIKVCGVQYREGESNSAWSEAVLFKNGCEVCCSEPEDFLEGEWSLTYGDAEYITDVKEDPGYHVYHCRTMGTTVRFDNRLKLALFLEAVALLKDVDEDIRKFLKAGEAGRTYVESTYVETEAAHVLRMSGLQLNNDLSVTVIDIPVDIGMPLEELKRKRSTVLKAMAPYVANGHILYEESDSLAVNDTPVIKGYCIEDGRLARKIPVLRWEDPRGGLS